MAVKLSFPIVLLLVFPCTTLICVLANSSSSSNGIDLLKKSKDLSSTSPNRPPLPYMSSPSPFLGHHSSSLTFPPGLVTSSSRSDGGGRTVVSRTKPTPKHNTSKPVTTIDRRIKSPKDPKDRKHPGNPRKVSSKKSKHGKPQYKKSRLKGLYDERFYPDKSLTVQEPINPKDFGGIIIEHEAQSLSTHLRRLTIEEIGVTTMQAIYDSLPYVTVYRNDEERLDMIADRLRERFDNYIKVLGTNKITVEHLYKFHVKQPVTRKLNCCNLPFTELISQSQYRCKISTRNSCDLLPPNIPPGAFNPGRNLTDVWHNNVQYFPSLKWQYFISVEGIHNEYPANTFKWSEACSNVHDIRHRDVFVSTIRPQRKHLVIVMDHGLSLSLTQLNTAKAIAKHLLESLSENDYVGVIGLAATPTYPRADSCLPHTLVQATYETRLYFNKFLDGLKKETVATNHSLGFRYAFEMIENSGGSVIDKNDNVMIMYISRGLLSILTEARDVFDTISYHNTKLNFSVIINTYAVIDDTIPTMYEKSFLQDVADQNFAKYDVPYENTTAILRGMMVAINKTKDLSSTVGLFYRPLNQSDKYLPVFSLPYTDEADRALTMSISQACIHDGTLIGVVGVDLHMEDIAQDITYFNQEESSYAFIINTDGYTIMHPSFSRPIRTRLQPMHTDIRHFENVPNFAEIREAILRKNRGRKVAFLKTNSSEQMDNDGKVTNNSSFVVYSWRKIPKVPYIVVIKTLTDKKERRQMKKIHVLTPELVYHRLDLLPTDNMCVHLKQLSTLDISTVFLAANSFINPFEHLSQEETRRMVQGYIAFLKDNTRLIQNPGLKDQIRNDVAATARINDEWVRRFHTSQLNDYIIRRYVATPGGSFRVYPGTLMDKTYDPTKRPWFERALAFPGYVTLAAPYLDVGGAGYIVTVSHTIFEGKRVPLHSRQDKVAAVMGMDITLGYFYKILAEKVPACEQPTVRCFIMDDNGYLISHPDLIEPNRKGPVEQQHITHKEPLIANDILNHRGFVQKKLCNRYNDRTVQRFYNFNTSLEGVLTNLVHGEHCARYQITQIHGTNAFLGIVNHTCDTATAFCPCSMIDRLCLNCHRMEQSECECPCECPLEMNFCTGGLLQEDDDNPSCERYPEEGKLAEVTLEMTDNLMQCYLPKCEDRPTKMSCLGVLGCEWCEMQDKDGMVIPLSKPHCATQAVCFGGILGAETPYGKQLQQQLIQDAEPVNVKTTPVGPVAGGIMGIFLVLALSVYCYRHQAHRASHQYVTSLPDNQARMSNYYETEEPEQHEELGAGHTNFVLAPFENAASISPYRVNTTYRRPAGGDSDHGYSTMTPHEDSEHASLPCLEPLLIGKDRFKPPTYPSTKAPVIPPPPIICSRRSRSPTPPQTRLSSYTPIPEQTLLPSQQTVVSSTIPEGSHSVIANVQVHVVDAH
ncbi:VWFA and cache domain-containing protein 1-like isoform X3 [Argonauta hians]